MDIDWKKLTKKVIGASGGCMKGCEGYYLHTGHNYEVRLNTSFYCKVDVIDKTAGLSVFRLDNTQKTGTYIAKFCKTVNKVALPVALTLDAIEIGWSIYTDATKGTTRNTVESIAGVAGGWAGGYGGAAAGAAVGTAIFQRIGTIVGGIVGGLGGGIGGAFGARAVAEAIGDAFDYDVEEMPCRNCGQQFKFRKYRGKRNRRCPECALF